MPSIVHMCGFSQFSRLALQGRIRRNGMSAVKLASLQVGLFFSLGRVSFLDASPHVIVARTSHGLL